MKQIAYFCLILLYLSACGQNNTSTANAPDKQALIESIIKLEKTLVAIQDARKDTATANALIAKTELFVEHFPKDSLAPIFLFRTGDVARGAGKVNKSISMWSKVWRGYSDHPLAPRALFAQAFTFDSELQFKKDAKQYYKKFLSTFPEHELAPQVEQLLAVIDQSPEELIRAFEKNRE